MSGEKHFGGFLRKVWVTSVLSFILGLALVYAYAAAGEKNSYLAPSRLATQMGAALSWLDHIPLGTKALTPDSSQAKSNSAPGASGIAEAGTGGGPAGQSGAPGGTEPQATPEVPGTAGGQGGNSPDLSLVKSAGSFTVLLVGVDNRPGEQYISNTDTLILANLNPSTQRLSLLSVPRDTQINFPGHGLDKINAAARLGRGLNTTVSVMENLLNQPIQGYIEVNFAGFKQIVDTLGGITVTVEKNMYYVTGDKTDGIINLKKGTQRLNGSQALQYVRFRHDQLADISRTMRQQAVLKAIAKEFWQVKTLPKLPWLIPQIYQAVSTNLPLGKMLAWGSVLSHYSKLEVVSQTLPGRFSVEDGVSYWKVEPAESRKVARDLFEHGQTASIFASTSDKQENTVSSGLPENPGEASLPVLSPEVLGQ